MDNSIKEYNEKVGSKAIQRLLKFNFIPFLINIILIKFNLDLGIILTAWDLGFLFFIWIAISCKCVEANEENKKVTDILYTLDQSLEKRKDDK